MILVINDVVYCKLPICFAVLGCCVASVSSILLLLFLASHYDHRLD